MATPDISPSLRHVYIGHSPQHSCVLKSYCLHHLYRNICLVFDPPLKMSRSAMMWCALSVLALWTLPTSSAPTDSVRVGAFNIQTFGKSKGDKPEVMDVIKKIVDSYDIILIQEIREKSGDIMHELLALLNAETADKFGLAASMRLGRTSYKEQYAYYYRADKVQVLDEHHYSDPGDVFEREPFSVKVKVGTECGTGGFTFGLVGVHIRPDDAVVEIQALAQVSDEVKSVFSTDDLIILGDLNADCSYASESELAGTALFGDPSYTSLIPNEADTTTKSTHCAYDRIVLTGPNLPSQEDIGKVDRFDLTFQLSTSLTEDVSDHYPVFADIPVIAQA